MIRIRGIRSIHSMRFRMNDGAIDQYSRYASRKIFNNSRDWCHTQRGSNHNQCIGFLLVGFDFSTDGIVQGFTKKRHTRFQDTATIMFEDVVIVAFVAVIVWSIVRGHHRSRTFVPATSPVW